MHEGTMILNMSSEIGHMLYDADYAAEIGLTEKDILSFFDSLILEFDSAYDLKNSDLTAMMSDIDTYFSGVTDDKDKLVGEEAAAAAAEIIAGAAMIAAAACSWIPGVNFAVNASALALEATAIGLEVDADNLKGTVVEEISNADHNLRLKTSFRNVKIYMDAQTTNTYFYPRFQLGMTILQVRAALLASVATAKKELGRNINSQDLKDKYLAWYDMVTADPDLVTKFSEFYDTLKENPENFEEFNKEFNTYVQEVVPAEYRPNCIGAIMGIAFTFCIRDGYSYLKVWKNARALAKANKVDLADLKEANVETEEIDAVGAETAESESMFTLSNCTKAIGVLAGVASITFGIMEAVEAAKTDEVMSKAISDSKSALKDYYTNVVSQTVE